MSAKWEKAVQAIDDAITAALEQQYDDPADQLLAQAYASMTLAMLDVVRLRAGGLPRHERLQLTERAGMCLKHMSDFVHRERARVLLLAQA